MRGEGRVGRLVALSRQAKGLSQQIGKTLPPALDAEALHPVQGDRDAR